MKRTFCTISTKSHIPNVLALYESLNKYNQNIHLNVCVIDSKLNEKRRYKNLEICTLNQLSENKIGKAIIKKYKQNSDKMRWGLKPVFMDFLITKKKYDEVIYVDNDIFFFGDYNFLFKLLDNNSVILTPHWRDFMSKGIGTILKDGFFNAGFIGCNKNGLKAIRWWGNCCLYNMEKDYLKGLYDDQRYLDLIPLIFKDVKIIEHKGCNVASWNRLFCKREKRGENILINNKWSIIFIHFTKSLIDDIQEGREKMLKQHYQEYINTIKKFAENKI